MIINSQRGVAESLKARSQTLRVHAPTRAGQTVRVDETAEDDHSSQQPAFGAPMRRLPVQKRRKHDDSHEMLHGELQRLVDSLNQLLTADRLQEREEPRHESVEEQMRRELYTIDRFLDREEALSGPDEQEASAERRNDEDELRPLTEDDEPADLVRRLKRPRNPLGVSNERLKQEAEAIARRLEELERGQEQLGRERRELDEHREIEEAGQRIEHLRRAAENLEHGGLHDMARELHKKAEEMQHELDRQLDHRAHEQGRHAEQHALEQVHRALRELREEVKELRNDVRELRKVLEQGHEHRPAPDDKDDTADAIDGEEDMWPDQTKMEVPAVPARITVSVGATGEIQVNGQKRTLEELEVDLKQAIKYSADQGVMFRAESVVPHRLVEDILAVFRRVKINKFSMGISIKTEDPALDSPRLYEK
jgi:DNA repair exonuclease SbcCD ATPase subunit